VALCGAKNKAIAASSCCELCVQAAKIQRRAAIVCSGSFVQAADQFLRTHDKQEKTIANVGLVLFVVVLRGAGMLSPLENSQWLDLFGNVIPALRVAGPAKERDQLFHVKYRREPVISGKPDSQPVDLFGNVIPGAVHVAVMQVGEFDVVAGPTKEGDQLFTAYTVVNQLSTVSLLIGLRPTLVSCKPTIRSTSV
jgi:hypothetical protein